MAFLIEALTKPDQIILDCFCGLGSTLVKAQQVGRLWIGCHKSRLYCRRAMKWLADLAPATNGEPIGGSRSPLAGPCRRRFLNACRSSVRRY
ncbi:MAG: DNA methyltransferase [Gemmataceae bacterium]